MAQKIEVKITKDRIEEVITVDEFIALQEGSLKAAKQVVGKFIVDEDGKYVGDQEGATWVGKMTIRQLKEIIEVFKGGVDDIVPNTNSAASV